MIKGSKEYLDQICKTHVCPEHPELALVVAWDQAEGYVIRCGAGHYPEEVTRQPSLTEAYKQGEEIPEPIKGNIIKGSQKRATATGGTTLPIVLGEVPKTDLGTNELLTPEAVQALIDYAYKYGLDPYRGHVCLMYGEPYVTIDGYLYHANRTGEPYGLKSKPLTEAERKDYQVGDGDHAWIAEVIKDGGATHFTGLGIVTAAELTEEAKGKPGQKRYPVVAAHPQLLAQKRAEWQVMRRAFPIGEAQGVHNEAGH